MPEASAGLFDAPACGGKVPVGPQGTRDGAFDGEGFGAEAGCESRKDDGKQKSKHDRIQVE
jgi:hypothetical protein